MTTPRNPQVDVFLEKAKTWRQEMERLREILFEFPLTEEFKWMHPCYTFEKSNIVLIHAFKDYCAVLFLKGALINDDAGVLIQQTENVQAGRQIRFTSLYEIAEREPLLKAYVHQAIDIERAGLKVHYQERAALPAPEELLKKLDEDPAFKTAWEALTPGRQRAYTMHFSAPKHSQTRVSRIEKCLPRILKGKGLLDCVCGHSQKMPACDGSHKSSPPPVQSSPPPPASRRPPLP